MLVLMSHQDPDSIVLNVGPILELLNAPDSDRVRDVFEMVGTGIAKLSLMIIKH